MSESRQLADRLLEEIMTIPAVDVHSHVPAADPFARSLRDLLGYHYYTELAHSSGLAREAIAPERPDEEMIPGLLTRCGRSTTPPSIVGLSSWPGAVRLRSPRLTPEN